MTILKEISQNQTNATINIGIVGEVSSGKSTTLNSIFLENYNETKRKRATCSINIYQEVDKDWDEPEEIFKKNTESDHKIDDRDFTLVENVYKVPPIKEFGDRNVDIKYNIIDLPGLNDSGVDAKFRQYIEENFKYFDALIFVSDGNSSMNKDAEKKLLCWFMDKIKAIPHIQLIVALSKVDDPDDDETEEVCDSATKIITEEAQRHSITDRCHITKFSGENGYLLRYIKFKDSIDVLSDKNIAKLATLIVGSKWRKEILKQKRKTESQLSIEQKHKIAEYIKDIVSDEEEMEEYYEMCNYQQFITAFNAMISDKLKDIYEGKMEVILSTSNQPGWEDMKNISLFYKNSKKKFGNVGKVLSDKVKEIAMKVFMTPNHKQINIMTLLELYNHMYAIVDIKIPVKLDGKFIDEVNGGIRNRLCELIKKCSNDVVTLKSDKKLYAIDVILLDWHNLFKNDSELIDTLYDAFPQGFVAVSHLQNGVYSKILNYINDKSLNFKIVKKLTDKIICNWFDIYASSDLSYHNERIDFLYNIKSMYNQCRELIEKYSLLEKLIILYEPMQKISISNIQKYDSGELVSKIDNESICNELKVLCCRITE